VAGKTAVQVFQARSGKIDDFCDEYYPELVVDSGWPTRSLADSAAVCNSLIETVLSLERTKDIRDLRPLLSARNG
jgi:hypothetical protein